MTRACLAIRHVHFEHLGLFADVLGARGYAVRYLEAGSDDLAGLDPGQPDLLAVLGGPIGAYEEDRYPFLADEIRLLERRLAADRPTLGICLGAQLMARALGARVYPGPGKEIGWGRLDLTEAGGRSPLRHMAGERTAVLHWHGDTFDLPPGSVRLASSPAYPNQAFARGRSALGLQFHAEVRAEEIERWLIGHACELAGAAGLSLAALRTDTRRLGPGLARQGRAFLEEWLDQITPP
jgi:GMP synthase (glutamine-hydrolysing)